MNKIIVIWSLVFAIAASYDANALVILQYHHVSNDTPKSTSISPKLFERHLELIEAQGYQVISIERVADALRKQKSVPDKTVVITFDDGYRSIFDTAFPMLKKRDWPFTVFVNTQPHDEAHATHMTWSELKTLSKHNDVTIANHSHSHAFLIRQKQSAADIFKSEIEKTEARIKQKLGVSHKLFAYPFGEYNSGLMTQLEQHGYLAFGQHSGAVATDVNRQLIPRFPFGGAYGSEDDFIQKLKSRAIDGMQANTLDSNRKPIDHPVLTKGEARPIWRLKPPGGVNASGFNCFASGQGRANIIESDGMVEVQAKKALPYGRSRYNCTALSQPSRFYWHSQLWIRRQSDGTWKPE